MATRAIAAIVVLLIMTDPPVCKAVESSTSREMNVAPMISMARCSLFRHPEVFAHRTFWRYQPIFSGLFLWIARTPYDF
jgi:hypothetical protein